MKEGFSNCLENLINNKPRIDKKVLGACFTYKHENKLVSSRRKANAFGWGDSMEWRGSTRDIFWTWLDCGKFLLEKRSIFHGEFISEYIDISEFFTDIHHPTDDELDLLGVVHPWAPPAILLLGEGLEYLMKKGRCVKI